MDCEIRGVRCPTHVVRLKRTDTMATLELAEHAELARHAALITALITAPLMWFLLYSSPS